MDTSAEDLLPADAVEVAYVIGAWGIKGAIKVKAYAADAQALFSSRRWYLQPAEGGLPGRSTAARLLRITSAREQGEAIVATAQEVPDRSAAEALRGARVMISRASFPTPDADEYYWIDLIGLSVSNRAGRTLGTVAGLIETGPHCVLRIAAPAGGSVAAEETLVPFVAAYVDRVDLPGRLIHIDWEEADHGAELTADSPPAADAG